jgi:hypothetical protein
MEYSGWHPVYLDMEVLGVKVSTSAQLLGSFVAGQIRGVP